MGALEQLIQNEIDKRLAKSTLISSVPCRVVEILDNEIYTVEIITTKTRFDLANYSGSPLSVGESVQVYYRGDALTSKSGYIGASLTKGGDGGKDVYILGTKTLGSLTVTEKTFCNVAVKALKETTITLGFNANILGLTSGDYVFKFYVDSEQYDYVVKGNDVADKYENCNVILPISLTVGEHIVEINGSGSGTVEDLKAFVSGQDITNGSVTIRQKADYTPFNFESLSTTLIDWNISGTVDGVGKLGKNYLKPRLEAIPNGAAGTWLSYAPAYVNAITGFTVNSGNATLLLFQIRHTDDSAILPSHVGDIMMVEGSTIPSAYDADTTMYKKTIMQGNIMNHNATSARVAGETQELYQGDDGGGGYVEYYNAAASVPIRCKTYSIPVEPNTDYSIRVFNSLYNDIEFYTCYYSEPGTITPTISSMTPYAKKSIPGNSTFVAADEQWLTLACSHSRHPEYYASLPCDVRPLTYEYCDHYATLKAGTYKVMIDAWTDNIFWGSGGNWCGFDEYKGCVYDNFNYSGQQGNEWLALLEENNTVILQKQDLLPTITSRAVKIEGATSPLPTYFHKEIEFTIDHDCKVGLFHRAYYKTNSTDIPAYFRFMIVDSTVEAVYFETTGVYGAQQSGYSAWEKYQVTLPVTISCGDESQTITFDLGDEILYEGDSISKTSTGIELPTYVGLNTITTDSENQPFVYIKYMGL